MSKIYFVVEMLRNDTREEHSYVIGIYDDELIALKDAWEHMKFRAGKYGAYVSGYTLNDKGKKVYYRELDSWDAFADSCKETAEKIKQMMDSKSE